MKRLTIIAFFVLLFAGMAHADLETDRQMSVIGKDDTYISADARAATEQQAYDEAFDRIVARITDYLYENNGGELPAGFREETLQQKLRKLTSQLSGNRWRVMLYLKKNDLVFSSPSVTGSKSEERVATPTQSSTPIVINLPDLPVVVSELQQIKNGRELSEKLVSLRKENLIKGAAAFPIADIMNFYVAVIDSDDAVVALLNCHEGLWTEVSTGMPVDFSFYKNCTAYWFTLP